MRSLMASKILRLPSVIELTGLSRSSIYAQIAHGTFPKQVSLGARAVGGGIVKFNSGWKAFRPNLSRDCDRDIPNIGSQ